MSAPKLFRFAFLLGILFWAAGCSREVNTPIRIGAIVWPGYEPLFLARELGVYGDLPVKLVEYTSSAEVVRAFQNRSLEILALTADETLRLSESEPEVRAIAVLDISKGADVLLAQPEIKSLKDLKGKKVGVEVNSVGVFMLSRILEVAGLNRDEVQVVFIENQQHEAAYQQKEVDALVTFEPNRSKLLQQGATLLFDSSKIPGEILDFLVVRQSLIDERPKALRKILDSYYQALDYLQKNPARAAEIMAPREHVSAEAFRQSLALLRLPSREESRKQLDPNDAASVEQMKKISRLMQDAGLVTNSIPAEKLLTNKLL